MSKWMRMGTLGGWLLAAVLGSECARAQIATTTVQDTVTDASGAPAAGTVVVSWGAFTTAAGSPVAAGSLSTTLGTGGALNVALQPNAGGTPMGSYYTATFHLSDGTTSREFWVVPVAVPGGGPAKLAGIRNQVLPASVAMQTVSKQYVDTAVAKAAAAGGTSATVHATSGTLDGVGIGQSTPAAVTGTTGIFTGTFSGTALLRAGSSATNNGGYSVFLVSQPWTLTGGGSHGIVESSAITGTAGIGYASMYTVATLTGSADHFNGYQQRQHLLAGATIGTLLNGYESQEVIDAGATTPVLYDFHALDYTGGGTVTGKHVGFYCDVLNNASGGNWCLYAPYGNAWVGKALDLGGDTGGDNGVGARFHKGAAAAFFKADDTSPNTIFTDNNANLVINGQNGGQLYLRAASYINFCNPYTGVCGASVTPAGLYHETLSTPGSSSASCSAGDFTDDANYHYVCVAANTWKRVALSSF